MTDIAAVISVQPPGSLAYLKIHPYMSLAWSVISAVNKVCLSLTICGIPDRRFAQVLINQKNRDEHIIRLASTMSDVFTFVDDTESLKKIKKHEKTITLILQQVTECGYFVADYTKPNSFCQSSPVPGCPPVTVVSRGSNCKICDL